MGNIQNSYEYGVHSLAKMITVPTAKYLILGIMIPSTLTKLPGIVQLAGYKAMFPSLPDWFWLPAGAWEAISLYSLFYGNMTLAVPMLGAYFGGVISAITVLHPKMIIASPSCAICLPISLIAGFGIGCFIGKVLGPGADEPKKVK
jgi:ribose/xylose/arabinose/galactoside ABC-type transport system permease subunit